MSEILLEPRSRSLAASGLVALLLGGCLEPPVAKSPTRDTAQSAAAAAPLPANRGPREFSHASTELMAKLKLGWNLGNSLDVPDGETAWGNPIATPELFQTVAKAGFRLVRIPVTWTAHTGPGPDYAIDGAWLRHVEEIVHFARAAGLYAVINLHHDGADGLKGAEWITLNDDAGNTTDENNLKVRTRFVAVWKQIARHFSAFGEELLFEAMNEIHDGYGDPDPRHFPIINDLNQNFVDVVRASGGNNAQRHLIVPGYNTNIEHTLSGFKAPADPTPNRLILSVHYYDPYLFTLVGKTQTWGKASPGSDDWGQEDFVVKQFDRLKSTFVDEGLPVLIGEYGATNQAGYEDYRRYYLEYVTKAAVDRGMLPVYWDNGGLGAGASDKFALFDRRSYEVTQPEILSALVRAATSSYRLSDVAPPSPSQ